MYLFIGLFTIGLFTVAVLVGMWLRKAAPEPQSIRISPANRPEHMEQTATKPGLIQPW